MSTHQWLQATSVPWQKPMSDHAIGAVQAYRDKTWSARTANNAALDKPIYLYVDMLSRKQAQASTQSRHYQPSDVNLIRPTDPGVHSSVSLLTKVILILKPFLDGSIRGQDDRHPIMQPASAPQPMGTPLRGLWQPCCWPAQGHSCSERSTW